MGFDQKDVRAFIEKYAEEGLYLTLPDDKTLVLTQQNLEGISRDFWSDPKKVPEGWKELQAFERCPVCPFKHEHGECLALRPILPLLEIFDHFASFDRVIAVYKSDNRFVVSFAEVAILDALKYVTMLSLLDYCAATKQFKKYYFGVNPLSEAQEAAEKIYLNFYYLYRGQKAEIDRNIHNLEEVLGETIEGQMRRLSQICRSDAFLNAFNSMHVSAKILSLDMADDVAAAFEKFEGKPGLS